jgi:hypothetical protein
MSEVLKTLPFSSQNAGPEVRFALWLAANILRIHFRIWMPDFVSLATGNR